MLLLSSSVGHSQIEETFLHFLEINFYFTHLTQQILTAHSLCVRYCARPWGYRRGPDGIGRGLIPGRKNPKLLPLSLLTQMMDCERFYDIYTLIQNAGNRVLVIIHLECIIYVNIFYSSQDRV
jgi:hypothetical protein